MPFPLFGLESLVPKRGAGLVSKGMLKGGVFYLVRQEEFSSKFLLLLSSPLLYIPVCVPCN